MSNNSYSKSPEVAFFQLTCNDISEDLPLPPEQYSGMSGVHQSVCPMCQQPNIILKHTIICGCGSKIKNKNKIKLR